mmetsp:Transcript_11566/g.16613  ORF Transcript_11566/g.16613 Transcript_11566/m.16613 type:complete len:184 (-) Transcript_11566:553-1104(-)
MTSTFSTSNDRMPSNVKVVQSSSSVVVEEEEELAAISAKTSLKRARLLFSSEDTSAVILPIRNDPQIYKLSVARRIRAYYPVIPATSSNTTEQDSTTAATNKMTKTAQVIQEMKQERANQIRTGISTNTNTTTTLVVHREADIAKALQEHPFDEAFISFSSLHKINTTGTMVLCIILPVVAHP